MEVLNKAISTSPNRPRIVKQLAVDESSPPPSPGRHSPTMDEIELELDAMRTALANAAPGFQSIPRGPMALQRPPSPKLRKPLTREDAEANGSDSESSDSSSGSDYSSTSDTESSSDDEMIQGTPETASPKWPIMARNRAMGNIHSPKARGFGGISRARKMAKYPRLKKPIRLATILEVPEEVIHEAVSDTIQCRLVLTLFAGFPALFGMTQRLHVMPKTAGKPGNEPKLVCHLYISILLVPKCVTSFQAFASLFILGSLHYILILCEEYCVLVIQEQSGGGGGCVSSLALYAGFRNLCVASTFTAADTVNVEPAHFHLDWKPFLTVTPFPYSLGAIQNHFKEHNLLNCNLGIFKY